MMRIAATLMFPRRLTLIGLPMITSHCGHDGVDGDDYQRG